MPTDSSTAQRLLQRRVVVVAILAAITSTSIAILLEPGTRPSAEGCCWIAAQSLLLTIPGIAISRILHRRLAWATGLLAIFAIPTLMLLDAFTFRWIGNRFLSTSLWRAATELHDGLTGHITAGMVASSVVPIFALALTLTVIAWSAVPISRWWQSKSRLPGPNVALAACLPVAAMLAFPALKRWEQTRREMAEDSSRHPFCIVGLVPFRGAGPRVPLESVVADREGEEQRPLRQAVLARDHQQRHLAVDFSRSQPSGDQDLPDIVIVVVESFRRELVAPQVMPNLSKYAQAGLHCKSHFSGGNATSHGMFSLLNGLEAIWYERPVKFNPLLCRLLRSAGYELGFFAAHDDWHKFYMDGFISSEHFDVFETLQPDGLNSDRRAIQLASTFLDRDRGDSSDSDRTDGEPIPDSARRRHPPRVALLYLYATHATYNSYVEDQLFEPAADDRFLYPYSDAMRPAVWNRYKNSARTVDRFLAAVMKKDRVVIVTGDHGESFLDDGCTGHGIRISEFQNMTPAVLYVPGCDHRVIDAPTTHADLLPTLLSALGLPLSQPSALDGIDLFSAPDHVLSDRIFATRNYLEQDVGLIGPWTNDPDEPFAFRINLSLGDLTIGPLGAIDNRGYQCGPGSRTTAASALRHWLRLRLGSRLPAAAPR